VQWFRGGLVFKAHRLCVWQEQRSAESAKLAGDTQRVGRVSYMRRGMLVQEVHPTPYTLHPTPYTLHPTPYTLNPSPYTLHPTPYTLHPTPYTLHPTPYTLHPTPYVTPRTVPEPNLLSNYYFPSN